MEQSDAPEQVEQTEPSPAHEPQRLTLEERRTRARRNRELEAAALEDVARELEDAFDDAELEAATATPRELGEDGER
jgi:hypothetical protein